MLDALATRVLDRMITPEDPSLSPELARHFLGLKFTESEKELFNQLSEKAREGSLTEKESSELDFLLVVSHVVSALQSKARMSLKTHTSAA